MADPLPLKLSLVGETIKEIKTHKMVFLPWVLVLAILMEGIGVGVGLFFAQSGDFLQQAANGSVSPEFESQFLWFIIKMFLFVLPLELLIGSIGFYGLSVAYLRAVIKKDPPVYSVKNYFYWLGKVTWKTTRPILWILLPVAGIFFYMRSLLRYEVVGPLSLLRRSPELKRSWQLTQNNVWRIFFNQMGVVLVLALMVWGVFLVPIVGLFIAVGSDAVAYHICTSLASAFQNIFMILGSAVYSCTVYRILLSEQRPSTPVVGTTNLNPIS